jgi:3-hydroxyisobutyrate dehydrogenase
MIGTCEAFMHGREARRFARRRCSTCAPRPSAQSWALTSYCPVPGRVPASPANRDYKPGFAAALMEKDLGLAQQAAKDAGVDAAFGAAALAAYQRFTGRRRGQGLLWDHGDDTRTVTVARHARLTEL